MSRKLWLLDGREVIVWFHIPIAHPPPFTPTQLQTHLFTHDPLHMTPNSHSIFHPFISPHMHLLPNPSIYHIHLLTIVIHLSIIHSLTTQSIHHPSHIYSSIYSIYPCSHPPTHQLLIFIHPFGKYSLVSHNVPKLILWTWDTYE